MTFFALVRSIVLVSLASLPVALALVGLADVLTTGNVDGLFAVFAAPVALAFYGIPMLVWSLILIVGTWYAISAFGGRAWIPFVVFAEGAAVPLYLGIAKPDPTGALPGYEQSALLFIAASLMTWAAYAWFRLDLRRA